MKRILALFIAIVLIGTAAGVGAIYAHADDDDGPLGPPWCHSDIEYDGGEGAAPHKSGHKPGYINAVTSLWCVPYAGPYVATMYIERRAGRTQQWEPTFASTDYVTGALGNRNKSDKTQRWRVSFRCDEYFLGEFRTSVSWRAKGAPWIGESPTIYSKIKKIKDCQ